MKLYQIVLAVCLPVFASSQDYNVALIPDSLKENANVVKRIEEVKVVIKSPSRAVVSRKYALTIFNEEGQKFSVYHNSYSKFFSLERIDGALYDAAGKQLKSVKKKDISDLSLNDDESLISDDRVKQHIFYYSTFPYTVEYEDELEYTGTFFLPMWMPVPDEKFSVQNSSFTVNVPVDYKLRYKFFNLPAPAVSNTPKEISYQWQLKNLKSLREEPLQPDWDEVTPTVYLAPTEFEFGGYKGDMSSWLGLGQYLKNLYAGRDQLPEKIKADIHRLTDGVADTKEKIRLVYEYMQKNTRYIGIQLGIGGWQPFEASFVANKGYGDCKALSNYTVSILKEAGIKANHVIIRSGRGERGLWEDFPAPYFNHVVMCVPGDKDTTWLECTNQTISAGYMGSSTGNRKALMLGQDGGYLVSTPRYDKTTNIQARRVNAAIDEEGNLKAEVITHFTGQQQELQHSLMYGASKEQREKYLNAVISLPTYKVEKSEYKETKSAIPAVDELLDISASNYATVSGKRLFIVPNLFNKQGQKYSLDNPRKFDIRFDYAFRDVDTVSIAVPKGYQPEAMGKEVNLQSKFGAYSLKTTFKNNQLEMVRVYEQNDGEFPKSDYPSLVKFYEDIYKADRSRVVLVKND
jgi:transglutaminase-like putative cysteine protease